MKVLVIGSGGREHALAWKLAQSLRVEQVYIAPGNGGTALEAKCRNKAVPEGNLTDPKAQQALVTFAVSEGIDLTVIGPEDPLAAGIVDLFRSRNLAVIGADAQAALLEASKVYSKDFMQKYGVRTAESKAYTEYEKARTAAEQHFTMPLAGQDFPEPLVVKADGLAAGKGVVVAASFDEADTALRAFMLDGTLGESGRKVILEDYLSGLEVSVLAAVSVGPTVQRGTILPFASARDHKRRFEHAHGPNTGGMGAIAPVPDFTEEAEADFRSSILEPTLRGMVAEGFDYRGFIFFGLMIKNDTCQLLEYNVRLGDPETQAVLPLMEGDFTDLCSAILEGSLDSYQLSWKKGAVCAPVAVAAGYPGTYHKGDIITINQGDVENCGAKLFMAGTILDTQDHGENSEAKAVLRTSGGRVLCSSAWGFDADDAWNRAYRALQSVHFEGMGFRRDIGREST